MDTDDLSREAYSGILIEAEKFDHDLTLQFGLLSYECKNEQEYLVKAKLLIEMIRRLEEYDFPSIFFETLPDKNSLHKVLDKLLDNISKVEKIPENKRHYNF